MHCWPLFASIGERVNVPTPDVNALLGLTRLFGRVRGVYPEEADLDTEKISTGITGNTGQKIVEKECSLNE